MRRAAPFLVFLFPFLYNFRLVYPNSAQLLVRNDFGYLYYSYKGYLAELAAYGHFPLWSPAEAGGYAFFGNPFAAAVYPLNLLPIAIRLITGSYTYWAHQIYAVFGVSLFALGLYFWLFGIYRKPVLALFAAITLSSCWSLNEFMRFPNAIHALAWTPWVLASLHAAHRSTQSRWPLAGAAAFLCQITAGYPYFVVYSGFLYFGYALYLHRLTGKRGALERAARQAFMIGVPVLLTAPYTSAVAALMKLTTDRAGGNFRFATEYAFGPTDLLGSFLFPPVATVEGCFYGGALSAFLVLLYFWKGPRARERVVVALGIAGFVALALGFRSYLFAPVWSFLPVVNQMRVFSRMTVILLPLLAVAVHQGFGVILPELGKPKAERRFSSIVIWLPLLSILGVQTLLYFAREPYDDEYMRETVPALPQGSRPIDFLLFTILTLAVVLFVWNVNFRRLGSRLNDYRYALMLTTLLGVGTLDVGTQGRFLWTRSLESMVPQTKPESPLMDRARKFFADEAEFYPLVADYFKPNGPQISKTLIAPALTQTPIQDFDYATYWRFWQRTPDSVRRALLHGPKLLFHLRPSRDAASFLRETRAENRYLSQPKPARFDGNELTLEVKTTKPGYLTWLDNQDPGWSAQVDGKPVPISTSLDTFKAVELDVAGHHHVSFRYSPPIPRLAWLAFALGSLWTFAFSFRGALRRFFFRRSTP